MKLFACSALAVGLVLLVHALHVQVAGASPTSDFVDLSFTCPAQTVCPQVCSPTLADCPEDLKCHGTNETLCADGSCAVFCDASLHSPCAEMSACSPVTCASRVTFYDSCIEDYGPWYEFATHCYGFEPEEGKEEEEKARLAWNSPGYLFVYCWVAVITLAIVHWCWYK